MNRLAGKTAIITGAARGMGESQALLFAAEGARVVVTDILEAEAKEVAGRLGDAATYLPLDVADLDAWHHVLEHTRTAFGEPDILVNNAGILHSAHIADTDLSDVRRILDINLIGPFLGTKVIGGAMAAAGRGAIVNVSSIAGIIGYSGLTAYSMSKWGLRGLTRSSAIELARYGVRVNSVHPGGVATPMVGAHAPALGEPPAPGGAETDPALAVADLQCAGQPIPRLGRPLELARAVLFLASDESSYCTGTELIADGGATAGQDLAATLGAPEEE